MKEIIYLDTKLVNSMLAQYNKGLLSKTINEASSIETNEESNGTATTKNGELGLSAIVQGKMGFSKNDMENYKNVFSSGNKELIEIALDDYALDLLLKYISEDIVQEDFQDGDIIATEGELTSFNFSQITKASKIENISFMLDDYEEFKRDLNEYDKIKHKKIPRVYELKESIDKNGWGNFYNLHKMSQYLDELFPDSTLFKVNNTFSICTNKNIRVEKSQLGFMQLSDRKIKILGIVSSVIDKTIPDDFENLSESDQLIRFAPITIINIMLGSFNLISDGDSIIRPIAIYFE